MKIKRQIWVFADDLKRLDKICRVHRRKRMDQFGVLVEDAWRQLRRKKRPEPDDCSVECDQ